LGENFEMTATRTFDRLLALGRGDAVAIAAPNATALTYDGLRALIVETIASLNEIGIGFTPLIKAWR
jgi:hypothetical protein